MRWVAPEFAVPQRSRQYSGHQGDGYQHKVDRSRRDGPQTEDMDSESPEERVTHCKKSRKVGHTILLIEVDYYTHEINHFPAAIQTAGMCKAPLVIMPRRYNIWADLQMSLLK